VVIYRVDPIYSEEARKAKYQGIVVLSAIVRSDGTIEILKVVRGLGLGLDESAIQALKQWKFRPAMKNGVPVNVSLNIEVNFTLR
jgi:TonB family protein